MCTYITIYMYNYIYICIYTCNVYLCALIYSKGVFKFLVFMTVKI